MKLKKNMKCTLTEINAKLIRKLIILTLYRFRVKMLVWKEKRDDPNTLNQNVFKLFENNNNTQICTLESSAIWVLSTNAFSIGGDVNSS